MRSTSVWAHLFRRAGAGGAGVRSRRTWFASNQVVESYTSPSALRRYTTTQPIQPKPKKRRTGLYILGGTVLFGIVAVNVSDDARYLYLAAQRTGRVTTCLALNINEYVVKDHFR